MIAGSTDILKENSVPKLFDKERKSIEGYTLYNTQGSFFSIKRYVKQ